jgi:predicted O-methyltransferase YrrM
VILDNSILYPETLSYLRQIHPFEQELVELEGLALSEKQPIVQRELALFLMQMCRLIKPKTILELGTNIGYSSICMAKSYSGITRIDSVEFNPNNQKLAQSNFEKYQITNINCILLPALDFLKLNDLQVYDLVFIDCNKKENMDYINLLNDKIKSGTLIIIDNILWKGFTTDKVQTPENKKKSTEAIKLFNQWMLNHKSFDSQILPIGDGITFSIKK